MLKYFMMLLRKYFNMKVLNIVNKFKQHFTRNKHHSNIESTELQNVSSYPMELKASCAKCNKNFTITLTNKTPGKAQLLNSVCPNCKVDLVSLINGNETTGQHIVTMLKAEFELLQENIMLGSNMLNDSISFNNEKDLHTKKEKGIKYYNNYYNKNNCGTIN